jgi:transcription antitermination factor NusG
VRLAPGQKVQITAGPFAQFIGVVAGVDATRRTVTVTVTFFGKPMTLALKSEQVRQV